jgi:hypothetical protein
MINEINVKFEYLINGSHRKHLPSRYFSYRLIV